MKRGDIVQVWWDAGRGYAPGLLYGLVIASGPKTFRVVWESNLTNRVRHNDLKGVKLVVAPENELDADILAKVRALVPLTQLA